MNNDFQPSHLASTDDFSRKLSIYVNAFENAVAKLEMLTENTFNRIQQNEAYFKDRVEKIEASVNELETFLSGFKTQTGLATFKAAAENKLRETERQLKEIQVATKNFQKVAEESTKQLKRVADNSANHISESLKSLDVENLRRLTFENSHLIEEVSENAVKRVKRLVRWFHWEKLGLALTVAVVVSLLTGLFINDESPWESHKQVIAEREAGKVLFKAWPTLTSEEKTHIQQSVTEYL